MVRKCTPVYFQEFSTPRHIAGFSKLFDLFGLLVAHLTLSHVYNCLRLYVNWMKCTIVNKKNTCIKNNSLQFSSVYYFYDKMTQRRMLHFYFSHTNAIIPAVKQCSHKQTLCSVNFMNMHNTITTITEGSRHTACWSCSIHVALNSLTQLQLQIIEMAPVSSPAQHKACLTQIWSPHQDVAHPTYPKPGLAQQYQHIVQENRQRLQNKSTGQQKYFKKHSL